jgi:hypothetical protein
MPDNSSTNSDAKNDISVNLEIPSTFSLQKEARLQTQTYELNVYERKIAGWLARGILIIFGAVSLILLLWVLIFLSIGKTGTDALEMAKTILPYLATPLGVALGYYFTRQTK